MRARFRQIDEARPSRDGLERELRLGAECRDLGRVGGFERVSLAQRQWGEPLAPMRKK